jgi:protein-S-isoprenylcysteine O-methyltransferase Ste14
MRKVSPANLFFAHREASMHQLSTPEAGSYAGAILAVVASLSLTQWSVIAGIVTALVTCVANVIYMARKDRREERVLRAQLGEKP